MTENIKQTNIGKIAKNVAATTIIGAGLFFGGRALVNEARNLAAYGNCNRVTDLADGCLSTPPEVDQSDTMTRSFNDNYVKMDETLKWNSEVNRWQIIDRKWEAVPQRKSLLPIFDKINANQVSDELIQRQKFFETPASTSKTECRTGVWDGSNWSYTYCFDQKTNNWQEYNQGPIYNLDR
jgi:hypothetical protein